MKILALILILGLTACATGEKFGAVEEDMSKEQVRHLIGKQDQIERRDGGITIYYYKNRLVSGFSWDKTDYYVVFGPENKVISYGHGAIDARTSDRMAAWSAEQQKVNTPRKTRCISSSNLIGEIETNCEQ